MNRLILSGHIASIKETTQTAKGTDACYFTLGVKKNYSRGEDNKDQAIFVQVATYGKLAQACRSYLEKGQAVNVEGRLDLYQYTDKDGNKRWNTSCIADCVEFGHRSNRSNENSDNNNNRATPAPTTNYDDEIPF